MLVTNARTVEAKKIKSEFRNYHFIMESCKENFVVGVPLSCLIEFMGLVGIVKALIPEQAPKIPFDNEVLMELKDLERYTRVKNNILRKSTLYDLSEIYESKGRSVVYINQLI